MNITDKIREAVNILDEIENYDLGINQQLSEIELRQQDLLHYIENNKINILWCYKMIKEIKNIREKRRTIKNNMEILSTFRDNKTKLISTIDNRKFLLAEIYKREKQLNCPYKNRQYTDEEIKNLLK